MSFLLPFSGRPRRRSPAAESAQAPVVLFSSGRLQASLFYSQHNTVVDDYNHVQMERKRKNSNDDDDD